LRGIVRTWFNQKGFGFILDDKSEDVFVHQSKILMPGFRALTEGQTVEFDIEMTPRGRSAINVQPIAELQS